MVRAHRVEYSGERCDLGVCSSNLLLSLVGDLIRFLVVGDIWNGLEHLLVIRLDRIDIELG